VSRFVLDTDTLTLFERLHPAVVRNVILHLTDHIAVTSITVEEQLGGWFAQLRSARTPQQIESAHVRMSATLQTLGSWDVLPFTAPAVLRFQDLLRQRLNVGGNDLRIAAIALETGAVVVTRNRRDFGRVHGLPCEDWSV
jgi:tRNA(fMet)-specific endonuclease VapC